MIEDVSKDKQGTLRRRLIKISAVIILIILVGAFIEIFS